MAEEVVAGLNKKQLMIYGGLGALGVGVVVYLRYKSGQQAPPAEGFPQDFGGGGGGGSYPVSTPASPPVQVAAPSQGAADDYQAKMGQAELDAANLQNQFLGEHLRQAKSAFDLDQLLARQEADILAPAQRAYAGYEASLYGARGAYESAQYSAGSNYYNQLASKPVSCPGKDSVRIDPETGQAYCRQKTSGGILGIPVGDIFRTVQGFVGGVERAAPNIGYKAANTTGDYYTQKLFGGGVFSGRSGSKPEPASRPGRRRQEVPELIGYGQLPTHGDFGGHF